MESNTLAIVRLAWSRRLDLGDDGLPEAGVVRVSDDAEVSVLRLDRSWALVGPGWLHDGVTDAQVPGLAAETALLHACDGHPVRAAGEAVLAYTDRYVARPGLEEVEVADDPAAVARLEAACPPDDAAEAGLEAVPQRFVLVDDRDAPLSGAGYAVVHGFLGGLGVLTPPEHRRAGHGTTAAAIATNDALDAGLVPQWRCRFDHAAARRMARTLGFTELGTQTSLRLL